MRTYARLALAGVLIVGVGCSAMPGQPASPTAPTVSVPSLAGTWSGTATITTCQEEKYGRPVVACIDPKLQPGRALKVTLTTSQLGAEVTGTTQVEWFWAVPEDPGLVSAPFSSMIPVSGPVTVATEWAAYPNSLLQRWTLGLTNSQTLAGTTEWTHVYSKAPERVYFTASAVLHRQ